MIEASKVVSIEQAIATAIVEDVLSLGYVITVDNGGDDFEIERASDKEGVLENMFASDWDRLFIYRPAKIHQVGWVMLVYGNDGWDVISDYLCSSAMNLILKRAQELAKTLQKECENA